MKEILIGFYKFNIIYSEIFLRRLIFLAHHSPAFIYMKKGKIIDLVIKENHIFAIQFQGNQFGV
jgi:hypothetical protein